MTTIVITRQQFQKIKEAFEMYDTLDMIRIHYTSESGIGPTVTLEYTPNTVKVDITDVDSW